ncbi:unnamed protein product [Spirodela intermedia]|uniref:Uncharacterized protein n=1 Tax=Spirodela intermedia TaxID=51605 RepID=A0A7I8KLW8_SPIIN|nr:unnamed protein product [Spirodela intermedia]
MGRWQWGSRDLGFGWCESNRGERRRRPSIIGMYCHLAEWRLISWRIVLFPTTICSSINRR